MMPRWRWLLLQFSRKLWLRASFFVIAGVVSAVASLILAPHIPYDFPGKIGSDAVVDVLKIMASSMLAVTTFSLGVMVQAYSAATNNVTPRATKLIMEDHTSQNVLGTFIGSFLFSLVGIIALSTGYFDMQARLILFGVTILVVALIVITLLRWIEYLSRLGSVAETSQRVEEAALNAMSDRIAAPYLGGRPLRNPYSLPPEAYPVASSRTGYVQHLDIKALQVCADEHEAEIFVVALPGTFIHLGKLIAAVVPGADGQRVSSERIEEAYTVGNERSFDQDPRFGLSVLTEIGSRALSPALNDPGTAIEIIGRLTRVLMAWAGRDQGMAAEHILYERVYVPPLRDEDLLDDAFRPLIRDGVALLEIQLRLQKALAALASITNGELRAAAFRLAFTAHEAASGAMALPEDTERLRVEYRAAWQPAERMPNKSNIA